MTKEHMALVSIIIHNLHEIHFLLAIFPNKYTTDCFVKTTVSYTMCFCGKVYVDII